MGSQCSGKDMKQGKLRSCKKQNEKLQKLLSQFQKHAAEIEEITQMILEKMKFSKRYKGWSIDKLVSESYYQNLIPHEDLEKVFKLYKDLAISIGLLLNEANSEPNNFIHAEQSLKQELENYSKKFSQFIESVAKIPDIPEQKKRGDLNNIQEIFPSLSKSQSLN